MSLIRIGHGRSLSRAELFNLLNTYNYFLKDKTHLHLTFSEGPRGAVVEGFLLISWGVQKPIRLKIQDEKQMSSFTSIQLSDPSSPIGIKRGMTRWGELDNLHHIGEIEETKQESAEIPTVYKPYDCNTLGSPRGAMLAEEESSLFRCMSDASLVKRRVRNRSASQRERARQHRFSINGHYYNYKTSIFTPSYRTATHVRINTTMTTNEVIEQLLQKFKIENDPSEFALYCIHQSGETRRLSDTDLPLWERILQGPSDDIMSMFLMDNDEEEVSNDVAQYLNLELPILEVVLQKLTEEENKEIQRIITKYKTQKRLLTQFLTSKTFNTETDV